MIQSLLPVAAGGALGASARYGVARRVGMACARVVYP